MKKTNIFGLLAAALGLTLVGCATTKPNPQAEAIKTLEETMGQVKTAVGQAQINDYWALRDAYKNVTGIAALPGLTPEQMVNGIETAIAAQTDVAKAAKAYDRMVGRQGFDAETTAKGIIGKHVTAKVNSQTDKEAVQKALAEFASATGATVRAYKDGSKFYVTGGDTGAELTVDIEAGKFQVTEGYQGSVADLKDKLTAGNFTALGEKSALSKKVADAQGTEKVAYVMQQITQGHYAKPEEGTAALDSAVKQYLATDAGKKAELGIKLAIPKLNESADFGLNMAVVYAAGAITAEQAAGALVGRVDASEDTVRSLMTKGLLVPGTTAVKEALDQQDCTVSLYRQK